MNILEKIIATKREEVYSAKADLSFEKIYEAATLIERETLSFSGALSGSPTGIIAEFKRRSPSKGFIKENADVKEIVSGYSSKRAAAISVLTDKNYFGGSLEDLKCARTVADIPLLRKDFIIDPYQICEARMAGADVILLIAASLDPEQTFDLAKFARSLDLEVLLEIHNQNEIGHINPYVNVVGVNNRDLTTFVTDPEISIKLYDSIPDDYLKISESGLSSPETVIKLRNKGFRGFLMGENFMKEKDPASALEKFIDDL